MDNASVSAVPEITAGCVDASLIHEAAIGKIAGEQLIKLMTLGLTEKEAEEQIVNGFLNNLYNLNNFSVDVCSCGKSLFLLTMKSPESACMR